MSISIQHNGDGSITVTCGGQSVIVPLQGGPVLPPPPVVPPVPPISATRTPYSGGQGGVVAGIVANFNFPNDPFQYAGSLDLLPESAQWRSLVEGAAAAESNSPTPFTIALSPQQSIDMTRLAEIASELPQGTEVQWQIAINPTKDL